MTAPHVSANIAAVPAARQPATMGDVAVAARVSHQTVSRVLNDSPAVRPETRERVLDAVARLGYRRNPAARALATRRSARIGVLCTSSEHYGPASVVLAVERAARAAGYSLSVANEPDLDDASLRAALGRLEEQSVEGIVVVSTDARAKSVLARLPTALPLVLVEGVGDVRSAAIGVDQRGGGLLATRHLLEQGVRTVHHVAGPAGWLESQAREAGWRQALADAGAPAVPPLRGGWSASAGYAAGVELAGDRTVEAVFAANDQQALGVLRAFREAGRSVPGDVLLVGFDDVPEAAYYWPPLTTVRQDFGALGRGSIELLVAQLGGGPVPPPVVVPAELVVRSSSVREHSPTTADGAPSARSSGNRARWGEP